MNFVDKVVLVTGASSGIGAAIAKHFAAEGANLAITGRNETKLKSTAKQCEHEGKKPLVIVADVNIDEDTSRIVKDTVRHYGKLDILVNNAGLVAFTSIIDQNVMEQFDKIMATNFRSVVKITNLAAPHLIETKGNIINISSISSTVVTDVLHAYGSSKAALDYFTKCVALELASKGVRVNAINPGPVKTDIIKNMMVNEDQEQLIWDAMKELTALNKISDPEEIADLALYLASDKARSITGTTCVIDNGNVLQRKKNK